MPQKQHPLPMCGSRKTARLPLISDAVKDRSGAVSVIFAVSLVALVPAVGVAVDCARVVEFKSAMQNAVDNAALAGASAYTGADKETEAKSTATAFINKAIGGLPINNGVTSAAPITAVLTSGGNTAGYTVKMSATGSIPTIFMGAVMGEMNVSVTATAENPIKTVTMQNLNASSDAWDNNIIYMYAIPLDNSVPKDKDLTLLYNNDPNPDIQKYNPTSVTLSYPASQNVGFALKNTTGALKSYGSNGYGGAVGSSHWMYSQYNPPSKNAYTSVTQNCLIQTKDITANQNSTASAPSSGSCFSTKAGTYTQNIALDCTKNAGKVIRYYWNDMGGGRDDHDYNDAAYTIRCEKDNANGPSGVALIQ